jgi:hypothetical protein
MTFIAYVSSLRRFFTRMTLPKAPSPIRVKSLKCSLPICTFGDGTDLSLDTKDDDVTSGVSMSNLLLVAPLLLSLSPMSFMVGLGLGLSLLYVFSWFRITEKAPPESLLTTLEPLDVSLSNDSARVRWWILEERERAGLCAAVVCKLLSSKSFASCWMDISAGIGASVDLIDTIRLSR